MKANVLCFVQLFLVGYPGISQNPAADLILVNGHIWTAADQSSFVEAVSIRGNVITAVGTSAEIGKQAGRLTRLVDLKGKLVTPGIIDAHIHFLSGSIGMFEVDLTGAKTIQEVTNRIAEFGRNNPSLEWISGRGWQYTMFTGGLPTKEILDAVIPDRPVFLKAYDGHSAWVNTKALDRAHLGSTTQFDGFGEIVHNPRGELTGVLKEHAQSLVEGLIPEPTREAKLKALRQGMELAASLGVTSIQNASGTPEELSLYEELNSRGALTLKVSLAFSVRTGTTGDDIDTYVKLRDRLGDNPLLRAGAVKFMLDGVIESHTGAMLAPYSDLKPGESPPAGALGWPNDSYRNLVARFDKLGFQIYTHAIGDRAVREALNAYENARTQNGTRDSRHRIEHIEMISPADLPRFSQLRVMASMEPIHAEPGSNAVWSRAVGDERLPYAFAWASLLKSSAQLVFSSDWPACVSLDPLRGLHTAVTRRTVDGYPAGGWVPKQAIPIGDALLAYTRAGAFSSFDENRKGRISPGFVADLAVFSQDLFRIDPMKIHESRVVMTLFNGKIIYEVKSGSK